MIFSRFLQRQESDRQEMHVVSHQSGHILWVHKCLELGTSVALNLMELLNCIFSCSQYSLKVPGPPVPFKLRRVFASKIRSCKYVEKDS